MIKKELTDEELKEYSRSIIEESNRREKEQCKLEHSVGKRLHAGYLSSLIVGVTLGFIPAELVNPALRDSMVRVLPTTLTIQAAALLLLNSIAVASAKKVANKLAKFKFDTGNSEYPYTGYGDEENTRLAIKKDIDFKENYACASLLSIGEGATSGLAYFLIANVVASPATDYLKVGVNLLAAMGSLGASKFIKNKRLGSSYGSIFIDDTSFTSNAEKLLKQSQEHKVIASEPPKYTL